jgi:hypothetical protein
MVARMKKKKGEVREIIDGGGRQRSNHKKKGKMKVQSVHLPAATTQEHTHEQ